MLVFSARRRHVFEYRGSRGAAKTAALCGAASPRRRARSGPIPQPRAVERRREQQLSEAVLLAPRLVDRIVASQRAQPRAARARARWRAGALAPDPQLAALFGASVDDIWRLEHPPPTPAMVRLAAEALREETAVRRDVIEALHRRVEELERELTMRAVQEV